MIESALDQDTFQICFTILKKVPFGKILYVSGSYTNLGNWNPSRAMKMTWTEGHYWHVKMPYRGIRNKINFEYKYFISDENMNENSLIQWERSCNRTIKYNINNNFFKSVEDIWEKFKICFRFVLDKEIDCMYIYGNIPEMGFVTEKPKNMSLRIMANKNKRKIGTSAIQKIWEREFYIPADLKKIQYRYGIKPQKNSDIIWEREPNRLCDLENLEYFKNDIYDADQAALGIPQKQTLLFVFKNSRYVRTDTTFSDHFVYSKITDKIACGPYPEEQDIVYFKLKGFSAILNVQTKGNMNALGIDPRKIENLCEKHKITYVNLPIYDQLNLKPNHCLQAAKILRDLIAKTDGKVYVHCTEGVNRSPMIVILYLHLYERYDITKAFDELKRKRKRFCASWDCLQNILTFYVHK